MFAKTKAWFADLWAKIKADVKNALALIGTVVGSFFAHIDSIATALGDPHLNDQIHTVITDAKLFGKWLLTVSIIATIAQFKKLVETPKQ